MAPVHGSEMRMGLASCWSCGPRSSAGPQDAPGSTRLSGSSKTVTVSGRGSCRRRVTHAPGGMMISTCSNGWYAVSVSGDGTPRGTDSKRTLTAPRRSSPGIVTTLTAAEEKLRDRGAAAVVMAGGVMADGAVAGGVVAARVMAGGTEAGGVVAGGVKAGGMVDAGVVVEVGSVKVGEGVGAVRIDDSVEVSLGRLSRTVAGTLESCCAVDSKSRLLVVVVLKVSAVTMVSMLLGSGEGLDGIVDDGVSDSLTSLSVAANEGLSVAETGYEDVDSDSVFVEASATSIKLVVILDSNGAEVDFS